MIKNYGRDTKLIKGNRFKLKKEYDDTLFKRRFIPPHDFFYVGFSGMGNYQDQHDFVDKDGHKLAFCPAICKRGEFWYDFLEPVEDYLGDIEGAD